MREHPHFRDELELLLRFFPDKKILTTADIMKYTGRSRHYLYDHNLTGNISVTVLADRLARLK